METMGVSCAVWFSVHVVAVDAHIMHSVSQEGPWRVAFTHINEVGYYAVFVHVGSATSLFSSTNAILQAHVCVQNW